VVALALEERLQLQRKESIKVVIAARRAKEGEETAQLVNDAESESIFVKTDVAIEDDVQSLVEKMVKTYGRLDYAFNNAGIDESLIPPFVEQSSDRVMKINVKGVWLCMKYQIPEMISVVGNPKCQFIARASMLCLDFPNQLR
jgi:NAD(P)-dependent dehydrogenase (short-subunit alcohol dehydrogenase family)